MQLKRLDISKATSIGWYPQIDLNDGLKNTYEWALKNIFI
jgi:nucleoside-diphosphate-sugar epimerase